MSTWFSYRLSDFILFSERVYWRLFDQVNDLAGVFLPVLIALGCLLLVGVWSRHRAVRTATSVLLAAFWVSSAVLFLWFFYTPVNWAARYVVPFFILEAGLIVLFSFTGQLNRSLHRNDVKGWLGLVLLAYAVIIHPFTSLMFGRTLTSAEIVGLAPDATALVTLGVVLATAQTRALWFLMPIPVVALTLSGLTLQALGTAEVWVICVALTITAIALTPITTPH